MRVVCLAALWLLVWVPPVPAADWPNFRGPSGSAVSLEKQLPVKWSDTENLAWKTDLPGAGSSSPIVSGDRVFVTCYSGYGLNREQPGKPQDLVRHLVCIGLRNGQPLWDKPIAATETEDPYQGMMAEHGYASHTPATDGERVYCFFGKSGVYAFDVHGDELWHTSVGTGSAILGFGSGASLALYKNLVIVNANAESESLIALDKHSGRQVWKTEAKGYRGSWSTPVIVATSGKPELVLNMPGEVWGLDPDDGGLYWFSTAQRTGGSTTVVASEGIVYSIGGGPGGSMVTAIRTGGSGDVTESHLVWKKSLGSYVPSPVIVDGRLDWINDQGIAFCLRGDTGEQLYRERLGGGAGAYASLTGADGKLYAVTRRNGTFVLAAGPKFEKLAHNTFNSDSSDFNASPAVASGRLLLRSNHCLYCITAK